MMILKNEAFKVYCAQIGQDSTLIQGAGGNTSYKENDILWIKASGTQLAQAQSDDIFIPLSLSQTQELIIAGDSNYSKAKISDSPLRPSIETPLHALMPHKIVIHVHSVDVIAIAVLKNAPEKFKSYLKNLNWAWIPYVKPGPELAEKISQYFQNNAMADILVLGNHGLVIAGNSLEEVNARLNQVLKRLEITIRPFQPSKKAFHNTLYNIFYNDCLLRNYILSDEHKELQFLAHDDLALHFMEKKWVLYPDHAVFLGGVPPLVLPQETAEAFFERINTHPAFIVVPNQGVLIKKDISQDVLVMLFCYIAVLRRILSYDDVVSLSQEAVMELLNWDAEKYRQSLKK